MVEGEVLPRVGVLRADGVLLGEGESGGAEVLALFGGVEGAEAHSDFDLFHDCGFVCGNVINFIIIIFGVGWLILYFIAILKFI